VTEQELIAANAGLKGWQRHRFLVMVGTIIVVALFLVSVALALYASSGAAQLDLSRPGYVSVRSGAVRSDEFTSFPAAGTIDTASLDQFRKLYDVESERATNVDSFSGDVMSDQVLSIDNIPE
jgi:hypothetical protein